MDTTPPPVSKEYDSTITLVGWLTIQLLALWAAKSGLRLSASTEPGGATRLVLAVQLISLALLFPDLLRSAGAVVRALACALPVLALAVRADRASWDTLTCSLGLLLAWTLAWWCWSSLVTQPGRRVVAATVGALLVLGMPLLAYTAAEFGGHLKIAAALQKAHQALPLSLVGPQKSLHFPPPLELWGFPLIIGASGILGRLFSRARPGADDRLSTSFTWITHDNVCVLCITEPVRQLIP